MPLIANVTNVVERPLYLPRLAAESLTPVDPNQTVVTNPTLGISVTLPAQTAINDADGTEFTGQISISEVPQASGTAIKYKPVSLGLRSRGPVRLSAWKWQQKSATFFKKFSAFDASGGQGTAQRCQMGQILFFPAAYVSDFALYVRVPRRTVRPEV